MLYFQPVLFHRPHNLISKGIRLVTNSYYNHAGAYFIDENGVEWFVEAVEGGVRILLWSKALVYYKQFDCEISFYASRPMVRDYKEVLGNGYEFAAFPRELAYYSSLRFLGTENRITKWLSNIDDKSKFVCFELVSYLQGDEKPWGANGFNWDSKKR